jgi:hypothetical protein
MRLFPLLLIAACATDDLMLPEGALPPPASVVLTAPGQLFIGETNTFTVTGNLGQQEPVYLAASVAGLGDGPCPPVLGGSCLAILSPRVVGNGVFDGPDAEIDITIPGSFTPGTAIHFQAVVIRGVGGAATVLSETVSLAAEAYIPGCTDPASLNYDPIATFDDGSCIDPSTNPTGTVLIPSSDFVDPAPPSGWTQCAGFRNTAGDDVTGNVLDNCLNTTQLRMRVWNNVGTLTDDVYVTGMTSWPAWPDFNYLGGSPTVVTNTHWNGTTTFFTDQGGDACAFSGQNTGFSLGNGNGGTLNISPADNDATREIRLNCGGAGLVGYRVALYR